MPASVALQVKTVATVDGPSAREGAAGATVADKVLLFGGLTWATGSPVPSESNEVFVFDSETSKWNKPSCKGPVPCTRAGHKMVTIDGVAYMFGGVNMEQGFLRDVYTLSADAEGVHTWSKKLVFGTAPSARDKHALVAIGKKMFVLGGFGPQKPPVNEEDNDDERDFATMGWFDDVFVLDTGSDELRWEECSIDKSKMPSPRAAHGAVALGNTIYVFGGRDAKGRCNDMWTFDTENMAWSEVQATGELPCPRSFHAMVKVDEESFVVTGGLDSDNKHLCDFFLYSKSGGWKKIEGYTGDIPPTARGNTTTLSLKDKVFLFGGSSSWDPSMSLATKVHKDAYEFKVTEADGELLNNIEGAVEAKRAKTHKPEEDDDEPKETPAECKQQ